MEDDKKQVEKLNKIRKGLLYIAMVFAFLLFSCARTAQELSALIGKGGATAVAIGIAILVLIPVYIAERLEKKIHFIIARRMLINSVDDIEDGQNEDTE